MPKEKQCSSVFARNLPRGFRVWDYDSATNEIKCTNCLQAIESGSQANFFVTLIINQRGKRRMQLQATARRKAHTFLTNMPNTPLHHVAQPNPYFKDLVIAFTEAKIPSG